MVNVHHDHSTSDASSAGKSEKLQWQRWKGAIISHFGTVREAADRLDCHPNSIRRAVAGLCPNVADRLFPILNRTPDRSRQ